MTKGLENLSCEDRLRELGLFSLRREGSRETLQRPASTYRGLQESWGGTLSGSAGKG